MQNRSAILYNGIFYTVALAFALLLSSQAAPAFVTIGVSINIEPPELPVYEQPPIPAPGYLWAPGYWAWADGGYYWVPGTWVEAPEPGLLWTPGYWGWNEGTYVWHEGYWAPHVGFYGGVNYGFGYIGHGYEGGYWDRGAFRYNRAYNNIHEDVHITNVYNKTVIVNENHVSFNGGNGGIQARPAPQELAAEHEHHATPVSAQLQHEEGARGNPELRASANHGLPPIGATVHAGVFSGQGVLPTHAAAMAHPAIVTPHSGGVTVPAGGTPHPAGVYPAVVTPHPAGVTPPTGPTPHPPTNNYVASPAHGTPATPSHGVPGSPGVPGGAGVPAHTPVPAIKYQRGETPGGPAPGSGHPGGNAPPPPNEREPHGPHDRPEGH